MISTLNLIHCIVTTKSWEQQLLSMFLSLQTYAFKTRILIRSWWISRIVKERSVPAWPKRCGSRTCSLTNVSPKLSNLIEISSLLEFNWTSSNSKKMLRSTTSQYAKAVRLKEQWLSKQKWECSLWIDLIHKIHQWERQTYQKFLATWAAAAFKQFLMNLRPPDKW